MGTRSLTFVHEDFDSDPIVCVYQQYDGYFSGVGESILDFLRGSEVVCGIPGGVTSTVFNGTGDLAARLITHFKDGDPNAAGSVYIEPATLADDAMGAEYAYHIYCRVGEAPYLRATDVWRNFTVEGSVNDFRWPDMDGDGNYVDTSGDAPMTQQQRNALFGTFFSVTGSDDRDARIEFTRTVLGPDAPESWSREGGMTVSQANRLLDVLQFIASVND